MNGYETTEEQSLPPAFAEKMKALLGPQWEAFESSYRQQPRQGLRVNPIKGSPEQLLEKQLFTLEPVPWAAGGFYYPAGQRPGRHPFHEAGVYYIQEPSAMAVAGLLQARPGERVLDLCAAPGGKTTQIAGFMQGQGLLVANEIHAARARILSQNVERLGIRNCLVTNETPDGLADRFPGFFHRILVDAPCSGEGMFRKDLEARSQWSLENVALCARRQQQILDCAARMLMPGGRLVYSTCTFAPEENEGTVSRFLENHPEFSIEPVTAYEGFQAGKPEWAPDQNPDVAHTFRLWPHLLEGEGHFAAVLRKDGEMEKGPKREGETGIPLKKLPKEYLEFAQDTLQTAFPQRYLAFGDHLYCFPEEMPALKGLKVLRSGLELGIVKKNRFEPAHALALALQPQEVKRQVTLPLTDSRLAAYLRGEAIAAPQELQKEKGWCLVCAEEYSLGWGKLSGGQLKNHYPKGLRWNWN